MRSSFRSKEDIKRNIDRFFKELKDELKEGYYIAAGISCIEIYGEITRLLFLREIEKEDKQ